MCTGLRISEALALKWSDVDWLNDKLRIERSIVEQHVDETKTTGSRRSLILSSELSERMRAWKQCATFSDDSDWIFASPLKIGRKPYSYTGVWRELQRAAEASGVGKLGTHAFRHTFRTWLNATGAPIATQQRMMRHSSIKTTMDVYGTVFDEEMSATGERVSQLAFGSRGGSHQA